MNWTMLHPKATIEMLGYIPEFLSEDDQRPAREQIHERYAHGGGWCPIPKESVIAVSSKFLLFRNDPSIPALAETKLRDETVRFYNGAWIAIIQPDGSYDVARVD